MGSAYAAHLHEGGHDVAVLACGKRLADIREHGVVLEAATTMPWRATARRCA